MTINHSHPSQVGETLVEMEQLREVKLAEFETTDDLEVPNED